MKQTTDTRSDVNQSNDDRHQGHKSPEQLEREVEQARERLGRTASELSDRLSPGELMDQALGMAREHGGDFGRNLGSQMKNNPIPMILTSVGISWMMMSSGHKSEEHTSGAKHSGRSVSTDKDGRSIKDKLGDTAAKSRDKAAAAGDHMHDASANVKESAQNVRESLVHFYRDQPLLAGSLGIAIGAALGALVPPTEMEDDMFGEVSDHNVEALKSKAVEKYDEVRESARSQ